MKTDDELCKKVVSKFAEIFGAEVGNMAMKVLPYGGIYLTGGVCTGIMDFL
jgi:glucokinase